MKKVFYVFLAFSLMLGFNACNKTDKETGEPEKFSNLTPEEHKTNLVNSGVDFVNEMNDLTKCAAAEAGVNVVYMMSEYNDDDYDEYDDWKKSAAIQPLIVLGKYTQNKATLLELMLSVRPKKAANSNTSMEEDYLDIAGTYEWDARNEEFDYDEGDQLIIKFPSTIDDDENNAVFTVTDFDWEELSDPASEDLEEVPVKIAAKLEIDGKEEMSVSFTGTYDDNGVPTKIDGSIEISNYEFFVKGENDFKEASLEYGTKKDKTTLIKISAGINGDFTQENIDDNVKTVYGEEWCADGYYDNDWNWICTETEQDSWEEVEVDKILEKAYGFIEVMNIRIGGEVDVKGLVPAIDSLDQMWEDNEDEEDIIKREAEIMNRYLNFYVAYVDDNKKIADVEFYAYEYEDEYEWEDCDYDENWNWVCETVTETEEYWRTGGEFVFGDESKIDAETYFNDGFDDMFDAMNDMIDDLNKQYEDYGIEIDNIDEDDIDF